MSNRLHYETDTYLRKHADNPVSGCPWFDEAFTFAREADKPVFSFHQQQNL